MKDKIKYNSEVSLRTKHSERKIKILFLKSPLPAWIEKSNYVPQYPQNNGESFYHLKICLLVLL